MLTAYGVFQGMRAAAEATWGAPTLAGRTVGVAGVGKVGHHLVEHLLEDGAQVVVSDVYAPAVARILEAHPEVRAVADTDALVAEPIDVYSPCALGDALTDEVVATLQARVVCGAANNQLAHPGVEKQLADAGILYAPDYVVNAGGLIQVADELHGFDFERARSRATLHPGHDARGVRARRGRGRPARGGRRPDRRAADGRRRARRRRPRDLAALSTARRGRVSQPSRLGSVA